MRVVSECDGAWVRQLPTLVAEGACQVASQPREEPRADSEPASTPPQHCTQQASASTFTAPHQPVRLCERPLAAIAPAPASSVRAHADPEEEQRAS